MNDLFCPSCGKKHESTSKNCQYCGEDLEIVILKLKQKHLPIKYQTEPQPIDEEKSQETRKNVSEFLETEKKLDKYDILPEHLTDQPMSTRYTPSMGVQTLGKPQSKSQKIKLQRREDPWWYVLFFCCDF